MAEPTLEEVRKEVERLTALTRPTPEEKVDAALFALGGLFYQILKDKKRRGEIRDKEGLELLDSANKLRKMANPNAKPLNF